ncbi:hypothetical protein M9Y10_034964 [Tritrichomonas musculus]|uniref:Uncharacterized protein n=1 Tax=Tritrichomonas musculus TaxID=1915356 RepID=A0ABR2KGI3_9EUKA
MIKLADDVAFDAKEVTFRDLKQLALMLNVNENEIDDIVNSVKDRFGIARDMKIKQSNPEYERVKNAVNSNLTDKIIYKLTEMI